MNITDIRIRKIYEDARLKALVSVTIDGDLAVHDIKVIEGPERLFVAKPAARMRMDSVILPTPSRRRRGIPWKRRSWTDTRPTWPSWRPNKPRLRIFRHKAA